MLNTVILLVLAFLPAAASAAPATFFEFSPRASAAPVVRPAYPEACVLKLAAQKMNVRLREDVPLPAVRYGSETPLKEFQDAIEPQWGLRPDFVLNAYVFKLNRVYLLDDKAYYDKVGRYIDDSLFHEYVHYLQVQYRGDIFEGDNGEFLEMEAIDHQTWFRENFMRPGVAAAEACGG